MAKIGIFGGSFNPIHNGHMNLALTVRDQLNLDKVIIVPSGTAPHKPSVEYAPAKDRLKMCRLSCGRYEGFEVSDHEILQPGKSYTVYTAGYFRRIFPEDELYLLLGSDMLMSFESWYEYRKILECVSIAAVSRIGADQEDLLKMSKKLSKYGKCIVVNTEAIVMSSSEIRKIIKNNGDLSCYLDEKVVKYIILNNLYQ